MLSSKKYPSNCRVKSSKVITVEYIKKNTLTLRHFRTSNLHDTLKRNKTTVLRADFEKKKKKDYCCEWPKGNSNDMGQLKNASHSELIMLPKTYIPLCNKWKTRVITIKYAMMSYNVSIKCAMISTCRGFFSRLTAAKTIFCDGTCSNTMATDSGKYNSLRRQNTATRGSMASSSKAAFLRTFRNLHRGGQMEVFS